MQSTSITHACQLVFAYTQLQQEREHHALEFTTYFHVSVTSHCISSDSTVLSPPVLVNLHSSFKAHSKQHLLSVIFLLKVKCNHPMTACKDLHSLLPTGLFNSTFYDFLSPHSNPNLNWSSFLYCTCLVHSCQDFV